MKNKTFTVKRYRLFLNLFLISLIIIGNDKAIGSIQSQEWEYTSEEVKGICDSVKGIQTEVITNKTIKQSQKKCDSDELYYGFQNSPDYIKARECALINNDYDILTMIYANGKGVKVDLNIALHYACLIGDAAPAEMEGRIQHLNQLKKKKELKEDFDICDDITSGRMMAVCVSKGQRFEEAKEKQYLITLKIKLSPPALKAFQKLEKAGATYFKARLENEMDQSGTGAIAFQMSEEMNLKSRMKKVLQKIRQCDLPKATLTEYQQADDQLNFLYKKTQKNSNKELYGITRNGIKVTERAWIKYKEAWIEFGQMMCPKTSIVGLKTLITKDRIKVLKGFKEI